MNLKETIKRCKEIVKHWMLKNQFQLLIFNMFVLFLFLLRSAGYFDPYFGISVNFIVMSGLILSIFIFKAKSSAIFIIAAGFLIFAASLRLIRIETWAERTTIYVFQALTVGTILLILENAKQDNSQFRKK